jgi:hypothetical protein
MLLVFSIKNNRPCDDRIKGRLADQYCLRCLSPFVEDDQINDLQQDRSSSACGLSVAAIACTWLATSTERLDLVSLGSLDRQWISQRAPESW